MDDVEEVAESGMSLGVRSTVPRHMRNAQNDTVARRTRPQQTKLGPKTFGKSGQPKSRKATRLNPTDPMDEDTDEETRLPVPTRLPEPTIPKVRPLGLDDDDDDGDVTAIIRKKPNLHPAKKVKMIEENDHRSGPIELNLDTGNNFGFGQTVDTFQSSPPTETSRMPLDNQRVLTNTFEGIPQPSFGLNPTEVPKQTTSTEHTTQVPINTENISQERSRPAAESVVSREGSPDIPQIRTNGIEPLMVEGDDEYDNIL
ncbi:hypothetical protein GGI35DRAFT_486182 [Trichoderma velutinum]